MEELPEHIGAYRILRRIGVGGMGEIFLGYHERLKRNVAIKRIRPNILANKNARIRFEREAQTVAKLNHPAIVQVYDILKENGNDCIIMEYIEGQTLTQLSRENDLTLCGILKIASQVCGGLAEAHRQGIVHRDLKSENVLITREGNAKITDFGIAKHLVPDHDEEFLTQDGVILGTLRGIAPEQVKGEQIDHRADLFSFGVMLYEMLTHDSPFMKGNEQVTLSRIISHHPPPVNSIKPEVPESISSLVDYLLQKDPNLRPWDAEDVGRELENAAEGLCSPQELHLNLAESKTTQFSDSSALSNPSLFERLSQETVFLTRENSRALPRLRYTLLGISAFIVLFALAAKLVYDRFPSRTKDDLIYVAVPPLILSEVSEDNKFVRFGVHNTILRTLVTLEGIMPLGADLFDWPESGLSRDPTQGAQETIRAEISQENGSLFLKLYRFDHSDQTILWTDRVEIPTNEPLLLANAISARIQSAYPDRVLVEEAL